MTSHADLSALLVVNLCHGCSSPCCGALHAECSARSAGQQLSEATEVVNDMLHFSDCVGNSKS